MPLLAIAVFVALFFVHAGYGMFRKNSWGVSMPNKAGWAIMEAPAFVIMLLCWLDGGANFSMPGILFLIMFEAHYFQRSIIFPMLMRGKGSMPVAIIAMGMAFNMINAFLIGHSLFNPDMAASYGAMWLNEPQFWVGVLLFLVGMGINLHSDHVIRTLRQPGDTAHYLPQKGMYRFVTSANYFGELVEWAGFAIATSSAASAVFLLWTFANLAPRAYAIRRRYVSEFGAEAVGRRKCIIPYIF